MSRKPKRLTGREVRRLAKFHAGIILESVMSGWEPPSSLVDRIGQENVDLVQESITVLGGELQGRGWTLDEIEKARKP